MAKTKTNIKEIPTDKFIGVLSLKLKEMPEFEIPEWALFVKTGQNKLRPPENDEWWYVRAASILRNVYLRGIVGTERLRTKYGSKKERGSRPEKFVKSSGKIIRTILQQGTKAGLLEHVKEKKAGRRLTKKGKDFLESIASELKTTPIKDKLISTE